MRLQVFWTCADYETSLTWYRNKNGKINKILLKKLNEKRVLNKNVYSNEPVSISKGVVSITNNVATTLAAFFENLGTDINRQC